jgi:1-deoxy-D-xylulose-5-phosphate synthase
LTFSAGLAADGFKPYFAVYSSFLQRGYDNVIHDIALQNLPVTLLVDRAGISGGDGPTHHGIFDVAFLSQIPNMEILSPSTFASLREAVTDSLEAEHPVAIRYSNCGDREAIAARFRYGHGRVCADFSPDVPLLYLIITYGKIVSEAMAACDLQNERMPSSCGVILLEQLKPYDEIARQIEAWIPRTVKTVVFLEEGIRNGGAGMILRDKLALPAECAYRHLGIDDVFDTDKTTGNLYADFGIGRDDVLAAMNE